MAEERITEEQIASVAWAPPTDASTEGQALSAKSRPSRTLSASLDTSAASNSEWAQATAPADTGWHGNIYFGFDQHTLPREAQAELNRFAASFLGLGATSLVIEGHCDERGTVAYNFVLGEKRAVSIKHYLEDVGIPGSSVETTSQGELRPLCREHNEACWSKNRRAELVID